MRTKKTDSIGQKNTETSLIEQFLYPKHGPGSLWEEVARQVQDMGGKIYLNQEVQHIYTKDSIITSVTTINQLTGQTGAWEGDYFFSTMPVQELIVGMGENVPKVVQEVALGLQYRDFINVGVLLNKLSDKNGNRLELKDNWIYIQERDVKVGRLMIYNNWGGGMIKDPLTTWIGMEYFCNKTDAFWEESDQAIQLFAIRELEKMELAAKEDVLDVTVRRMEKTYPAYFGTYNEFDKIRLFTDQFQNLFLVGRNGMHKYNNADHSMLTAMVAVDNISAGVVSKDNLWAINTEQEYHEVKSDQPLVDTNKQAPGIREKVSAKSFLLKDSLNKTLLLIAGIGIPLQFLLFKLLYPFAGFINGDSYAYVESAYLNSDISVYPVGYSKFLRFFSCFTKSDTALVAFQYLLIQVSALFFLYTVFFLFKPGKLVRTLLFILIVFNPVALYLSNYISSDSLFLGLSLIWITLLLWMLFQTPVKTKLILLQIAVLLLAFTIRYNALYCPIISAIAILLSRQSARFKIAGIVTNAVVVVFFIGITANQYYDLTGTRQFSPFSGWQLANNALYAYRYVPAKDLRIPPPRFRDLDKMVRNYFDTSRDIIKHPQENQLANTYYMWDPTSPLQKYMNLKYKKDSSIRLFKRWALVAPLYSDYGKYLIRQYPSAFFKYYLLPNSLKYYTPPGEFLYSYNMGRDTIGQIIQVWFNYKGNKVRTAFKDFNVNILHFLPALSAISNILFLCGFLAIIFLKQLTPGSIWKKVLLLVIALWAVNFGFSVFASPITLRYQLFAITVFTAFGVILVEHVYKLAYSKAATSQL